MHTHRKISKTMIHRLKINPMEVIHINNHNHRMNKYYTKNLKLY